MHSACLSRQDSAIVTRPLTPLLPSVSMLQGASNVRHSHSTSLLALAGVINSSSTCPQSDPSKSSPENQKSSVVRRGQIVHRGKGTCSVVKEWIINRLILWCACSEKRRKMVRSRRVASERRSMRCRHQGIRSIVL